MKNFLYKPFLLVLLLSGLVFAQNRPISLDYTNADLVQVLKRVARDAGMNIFISPEVTGRVTVKAKSANARSAMDLILALQEQEYGYKVLKNTIVVAKPEKLSEIPDDLFGR